MNRPVLAISPGLPIAVHAPRIAECLRRHQFVIVSGETGSGKTTQLPKICLTARDDVPGLVGHTQPRRLAARSVAARIAHETATRVGDLVGYQVRFDRRVDSRCRVKVMTDGILLAEIQGDPELGAYHTLIVDEAHERSLNIDFLLGHLKRLAPRRPDLRVVVSSATIDAGAFASFFDDAPVVEVSGRSFPVEVRYRPTRSSGDVPPEQPGSDAGNGEGQDNDGEGGPGQERLAEAVQELYRHGAGDILVFLASEQEIRDAMHGLRRLHLPRTEILPLFARLPSTEQQRIFEPHDARRIILATNIAETSLTVPGVKYVIDTGRARISRYQHRHAVQRLPVESISRASADQRKGRCGRTAPGVCIRLYSEDDFLQRSAYSEPEIQRADLAAVLLRLKAMGVDDLESFPFLSPPSRRHVNDGQRLLRELGAFDAQAELTETGRRLARMPVDPRVGRMLIAAGELGCLREMLIIAAALCVLDPRERPPARNGGGAGASADTAHARFRDPRSDFMSLLRLWRHYHRHGGRTAADRRRYCRKHFLAESRMREWLDVHDQLRQAAHESGLSRERQSGTYTRIHRALVCGLVRNVGRRVGERDYAGLRELVFRISPGSGQYQRRPKWVVAAELTETHRLYAYRVAEIRPEWIEGSARDLLRRAHFDAHWDARRAEAMIYEQTALYGLTLSTRRRVRLASVSRENARALFIQAGLVEQQLARVPAVLEDNQRLIESLREFEHKLRRPDVLVSDEDIFDFYDARLPEHVCDAGTFFAWLRRTQRRPDAMRGSTLRMTLRELARRSPDERLRADFPDVLVEGNATFGLRYRFAPGEDDDGITVIVPVAQLAGLEPERFEWLVPGRLEEKTLALLRLLPKGVRRELMPLAAVASQFVEQFETPAGSLSKGLVEHIRRSCGLLVESTPWHPERLRRECDAHLLMRYEVIDAAGHRLGAGRTLAALQRQLATHAEAGCPAARRRGQPQRTTLAGADPAVQARGLTDWTLGTLPESVAVERHGVVSDAYPTLVDNGRSVDLVLLGHREQAEQLGRRGLRRLFWLRAGQPLRRLQRNLTRRPALHLAYALVPEPPAAIAAAPWVGAGARGSNALGEDLQLAIIERTFVEPASIPRTREQFEGALERGLARIDEASEEVVSLCEGILAEYRTVRGLRDVDRDGRPSENLVDIDTQLAYLVWRGFIAETPFDTLREYPRYLRALALRLEKLRRGGAHDGDKLSELAPLWNRYVGRVRSHRERGRQDPELTRYRWMIEEYRVSLFAQEVGAAYRISPQRLEEQWRRVAS